MYVLDTNCDADGSEYAGHTSDGTVVVGAGLKQQRELAEPSVDAETRMQGPCVSGNSAPPQWSDIKVSTEQWSSHGSRTPPSTNSDTPGTDSLAASPAADAATKKKRGRPKGSKNKPRKKQSSEQYEEVEQHEVVEAPAGSYNTRRARRINYARLDDPFSSE